VKIDARPLFRWKTLCLIKKAIDKLMLAPRYFKLKTGNCENATKIITSECCHLAVFGNVVVEMIAKGLAFIYKWTDEDGQTFSRIFTSVPEMLNFHYCQGMAKKNTGDPNNKIRDPVSTGGYLIADLLNGGKLIQAKSFYGEGGFFYETDDGEKFIFKELEIHEFRDGSIDVFQVQMPICTTKLKLHQVILATGRHYGISVNEECHHTEGGCLAGVLEEGETMAKFNCIPRTSNQRTLLAQGLVEDPSQHCDGDHTYGRNSKYLHGLPFVQGVAHQENTARSKVEDDLKQWINPLLIGTYICGNIMPTDTRPRFEDVDFDFDDDEL